MQNLPPSPMDQKNRNSFLAALGFSGLYVLALGLLDLLTGETRDWRSIIHTDNPINWVTSAYLILAGVFAAQAAYCLNRDTSSDYKLRLLLPCIAFVFLFGGLDEMFEIHEWVGRHVSTPSWMHRHSAPQAVETGIHLSLQGFSYVLTLYVGGSWVAFFLIGNLLRKAPLAFFSFLTALGFHTVAWASETFFQQADSLPAPWVYVAYLEEASELFGCHFFAVALFFLARKLQFGPVENR